MDTTDRDSEGSPVAPLDTEALVAYLDQLEPPIGYGDDPKHSFESGFGWAMDALFDWLDGRPWTGGIPQPARKRP